MPQVKKKRLVSICRNELQRFVGQSIRDVFAIRAIGDGSQYALPFQLREVLVWTQDTIRGEVGVRRSCTWFAMESDIKSLASGQ